MHVQTKNRLTIIFLFLLFFIPVLIAVFMNSSILAYKPSSTKNQGQLVKPPVLIAEYVESLWVEELEGIWTLLYRDPEPCDESCQQMLKNMYKIRLTMGHKADKLQLMALHNRWQDSMTKPPNIKMQSVADLSELSRKLDQLSDNSLGQGKGLYIVAPEGYLMMSYTHDHSPSDIVKDLKLLLKRKGTGS